MENQQNQRKSISDQLMAALAQLSTDQIRFVVARQDCATDKEAAMAIGIKPDTAYHWPPIVKEAVRLMTEDGLSVARHVRRRNLAKAMLVKVGGLDSGDESLRQRVATEIIEWEMGRAQQPIEHGGGVTIYLPDNQRDDKGNQAPTGATNKVPGDAG
jgi:hypothetical protein